MTDQPVPQHDENDPTSSTEQVTEVIGIDETEVIDVDTVQDAAVPPPPPAAEPAPEYAQAYVAPAAAPAPQQAYPAPQVPAAYTPPPAQPMSPNEERTWGMASHLIGAAAMVLSAGFLGFVGSLVLYLVCKDRGPFVRAHAANSLNVQITAGIGFILGWILTITVIGAIIGIPLLIATFIWALVVHVIGAVKANNGEWWTPPMTIQFVK